MSNGEPEYISNRLVNIFNKLGALIEGMDHFHPNDARKGALGNLKEVITPTIMQINLFVSLNQGVLNRRDLEKIWKIEYKAGYDPDKTLNKAVEDVDIFLRSAFLTGFLFHIENLFKHLQKALINSQAWKYSKITKNVLKELFNDTTKIDYFFEILITTAKIRNSLHANGLHLRETSCTKLNNIEYKFIKGELVLCASWVHIINLIELMLTVIEEIFSSTKIKQIAFIEDVSIKKSRKLKKPKSFSPGSK